MECLTLGARAKRRAGAGLQRVVVYITKNFVFSVERPTVREIFEEIKTRLGS